MTSSTPDQGEERTDAEQQIREMLEVADLTDEEAEARDRRAGRRDAARQAEITADDEEARDIEHRNLDRFLAGRERDDAIGLNTAVRRYLNDGHGDGEGEAR